MSGVLNVVIGGGTGNIGKYLATSLLAAGHNVSVVSRGAWSRNKAASKSEPGKEVRGYRIPHNYISWKDIEKDGLPLETDVVINLSGKTIGQPGPWVKSLKKTIYDSRIDTTKKLAKAIERSESPPKVFISASAVGAYGLDPDKIYTENDSPVEAGKETYFTDLCRDWENSSKLSEGFPTRVINPRLGVVLAHDTDPLKLLLKLAITGSSVVGSGKQPFPWIHMSDAVQAMHKFIEDESVSGPVNLVAPQIVDNLQFTHSLASACMAGVQKVNLPEFLVRLLYGTERANNILLDSPRVTPQKLLDLGFQFKYEDIDSALRDIVEAECKQGGVLNAWIRKKKG